MYNVRTIDAVLYNGSSQQGSTKPYIMECGPWRDEFYVKLKGAKKGSKRYCIKELVCGLLAKELGIEIPDFALINIEKGLGEGVSDPDAEADISNSEGLNFGSKLLRFTAAYRDYDLETLGNFERIHDIIAFDAYILNEDRKADNPNLIISESLLYVIDHGFTLPFLMGDDLRLSIMGTDELSKEPFDKIKSHPLLNIGEMRKYYFDAILDKLGEIGDTTIEGICKKVPSEWFDRASDRDKICAFLIKRKNDRAILSRILEAGLNG